MLKVPNLYFKVNTLFTPEEARVLEELAEEMSKRSGLSSYSLSTEQRRYVLQILNAGEFVQQDDL
jgi:hypothetical protein